MEHLCIKCEGAFKSSEELEVHQSYQHGKKQLSCSKKIFSKPGHLNIHIMTHTRDKGYDCSQCGKVVKTLKNLQTPQRLHTGERPFECPLCDKSFSHSGDLKNHNMIHSGEKRYDCLQCGKSFSLSGNLKKHQRSHTGEKQFICTYCEKSFS
jgi:KRAB domain-containing zinc finger protein